MATGCSGKLKKRFRKHFDCDDSIENDMNYRQNQRNEADPIAFLERKRCKFVGVRQRPSGRWVAEIKDTIQKIRLWLGTYDSAEDAARAYDEAARLLRGNNTRTNFWPSPSPEARGTSALPARTARLLRLRLSQANARNGVDCMISKTKFSDVSRLDHQLGMAKSQLVDSPVPPSSDLQEEFVSIGPSSTLNPENKNSNDCNSNDQEHELARPNYCSIPNGVRENFHLQAMLMEGPDHIDSCSLFDRSLTSVECNNVLNYVPKELAEFDGALTLMGSDELVSSYSPFAAIAENMADISFMEMENPYGSRGEECISFNTESAIDLSQASRFVSGGGMYPTSSDDTLHLHQIHSLSSLSSSATDSAQVADSLETRGEILRLGFNFSC